MKRCWIYCGVKPHTSLAEMGLRRQNLKKYADEREYKIVSITSENMYGSFVQCKGALDVLSAVTNEKMDILLLEKGILDRNDEAIKLFLNYARNHNVEIEEIDFQSKGE